MNGNNKPKTAQASKEVMDRIIDLTKELYELIMPGATLTVVWKVVPTLVGTDVQEKQATIIITKPALHVNVNLKA